MKTSTSLSPLDAPVYHADGFTKLSGSQFLAELFAGTSANDLRPIATTGFLTANGAGYFHGGTQTLDFIFPGSTAWVQVDVWNTASGASFTEAKASGLPDSWWASSTFPVRTGGWGMPPAPAAPLTGLGTSPVYLNTVPEPSTFTLAGVGAVLMFFRRWRGGQTEMVVRD